MNRAEEQPKSSKDLERAAKKEALFAWLRKKWPIIIGATVGVVSSLIALRLVYQYVKERASKKHQKELEETTEKQLLDEESLKARGKKLGHGAFLPIAREMAGDFRALAAEKGGEKIIEGIEEISEALGVTPGGSMENHLIESSARITHEFVEPQMVKQKPIQEATKQSQPQGS